MTTFETLKNTVIAAEADYKKFEAGNSAAGTRVRKSMQEIKTLAQQLRTEVTQAKNSK